MGKSVLIGLAGKAGTGKDAAGAYLQTRYGIERYAFASPLKFGLQVMLGLDGRHTDGALKEIGMTEFGGMSPRQLMQSLGTEWGRSMVADTVWVDRGLAFWDRMSSEGKSVVITDVRFQNEAEMIRSAGGVIVRIVRDSAKGVAEHSSERGVPRSLVDASIQNNGSIKALHQQLDDMMNAAWLLG